MPLAIFDIDGTLVDTHPGDDELFTTAVQAILGVSSINTRWEEYQHPTDCGVAHELFVQHLGRPPLAVEVQAMVSRYTAALAAWIEADSSIFQPIAGAPAFLDILVREPDWLFGFATGSWRQAVLLKLRHAGFSIDPSYVVSCEHHPDRREIIRRAVQRAQDLSGRRMDEVVYVGDRAWDLDASNSLGVPFVGVGSNLELARRLPADYRLADFSNRDHALATLLRCSHAHRS